MVISRKPLQFIVVALVALLPVLNFANPTQDTVATEHKSEAHTTAHGEESTQNLTEEQKAELERKEYVKHHLLDSHDFTLFSYGEGEHQKHVGFPLPVILWDNGLHIFSSSKFHHGEAVAESNGNYYKINHHNGKVYKTDAEGTFT
jgi:F-type H+-transporting ATPase subunit a